MANTDDMINVAESKFEELVRQNTAGVCEAKKRMIGENGPQTHRPSMEDSFMAQAT